LRSGDLRITPKARAGSETLVDDFSEDGKSLARAKASRHRLLYLTPRLKTPVHLSGTPTISVRLACNRPAANLSVWLVSLPWGEGRKGSGGVITRGWADPQNHRSLRSGEPLVRGEVYEITFDLQPDDQVIAKGQQIGLMIFSTDRDFTLWPKPGTKLTIDLEGTTLSLPVVGGAAALRKAGMASAY
jgi:X-Pro dipeptidyl-peptidase